MEKVFQYVIQNAGSALGVTILTGLTVSSSAVGATKIVQSIQVKEPKTAVVRNHVVELPDQASDRAKTVILAKFGTRTITPTIQIAKEKKSTVTTSVTPTVKPTTFTALVTSITSSPTPTPNNANKCIVTLFSKQYDVTPLQTGHSGGNIFTCGTDMTAIYQSQHGTNISRMAQYLVTNTVSPTTSPPATSPTTGPITSPTSKPHSESGDDEDEDELEDRHEYEKKALEKRHESEKKEYEIDDDFEDDD